MKTYYKVVRMTDKGGLVSALVGNSDHLHLRYYQRSYAVDRWTTGYRATPVLAFESLTAASNFAGSGIGVTEIWEVRVRRPRKINYVARLGQTDTFVRFWRAITGKRWWQLPRVPGDRLQTAPRYTVACEAIMLVKRAK